MQSLPSTQPSGLSLLLRGQSTTSLPSLRNRLREPMSPKSTTKRKIENVSSPLPNTNISNYTPTRYLIDEKGKIIGTSREAGKTIRLMKEARPNILSADLAEVDGILRDKPLEYKFDKSVEIDGLSLFIPKKQKTQRIQLNSLAAIEEISQSDSPESTGTTTESDSDSSFPSIFDIDL